MPSLAAARAKTAANPNSVSNGGPNLAPSPTPENLVQIPTVPSLDLPVAMPQRGVFPVGMVLDSDRSDSTRVFRSQNMRSPVFQNPPSPPNASVVVAPTASVAAITAALEILVNNQEVPNQDILNFLNSTTVQF